LRCKKRETKLVTDSAIRVQPSFSIPEEGYSRKFSAQIDYLGKDLMKIRGELDDRRIALRYTWTVQVPQYTIVAAEAQHLSEDPSLDVRLEKRASGVVGAHTSYGFTKEVRAALGGLNGAREHLSLAIDMARVSLQGFPVPLGDHERFAHLATGSATESSRIARMAWERDRADWGEVSNSCFAYRDESAVFFEKRDVECFDLSSVSPEAGEERFFWRRKSLDIKKLPQGSGYTCENSMVDTFHDIGIGIDIDNNGTIIDSRNSWRRLAYKGICEGGQTGPAGLVGKTIDSHYSKVVANQVGGRKGCSHLFDMTVDCLRFFDFSD
jgi:hypothetical protein